MRVLEAAPRHALVRREGEEVLLADLGSTRGTYLAGEEVQEAVLRDGDVVQLGEGGPKLRFQKEGPWRWPFGHRMRLGWLLGARPGTSPSFRVAVATVLVLGSLVVAWSWRETRRLHADIARLAEAVREAQEARQALEARIEAERRSAEEQRTGLEARIEEYSKREDELSQKLADAQTGEAQALRAELASARGRLSALEAERAVGERIIREYGGGVCLIQGAYSFYDPASRPLRVKLDEEGEPVQTPGGGLALSPEASGPVHRVDYFGTGFLADRTGLVLTNRHVAEPWAVDEAARALAQAGFRPRFTLFRAFFPRQSEPFELDLDRHSEIADLSLLKVDLRGKRIPVLPLDTTGRGAVAGQPVVVVGYPTGIEAILAKADGAVVRQILEAHGTSSERVAEALARKALIRPSTTQGHIGDITKSDIVFDAPTTHGGSGGPVFGRGGQVVAIEYAVLSKFGGNSFGVPVRHAQDLLRASLKEKRRIAGR